MATSGELKLRPAVSDDCEMLFIWRNDPFTREMSHSTSEIKRDDHNRWFEKTLKDPTRKIFIAEESGEAVGTVRTEWKNGKILLSWTVSPQARGKNVGKRMVALLVNSIKEAIVAEVKKENVASARIAEYAGLKLERDENGVCYYCRGPL